MSSTVLYLAIVAVWAIVLVPMWLRRDTEASGFSRLLNRRPGHGEAQDGDDLSPGELTDEEDDEVEAPERPAPRRRPGRAAVIARRRRRTTALTLLAVVSLVGVATGSAPWWAALPPIGLLAAHLGLLRVAVGMDTAQRRAAAARHADRQAREAAEHNEAQAQQAQQAEQAEVIDLVVRPPEVFDQYADDRRAVGE